MYALSDLTLYSKDVLFELFAIYNTNIWPVHLLTFIFGLSLVYLTVLAGSRARKGACLGLGLCWIWVAVAFQYINFTTINWMAYLYALLFAIQGVLLIAWALFSRPLDGSLKVEGRTRAFLVLLAFMVVPISGYVDGRSWNQIDYFGVAPDSTALATVCYLLITAANRWWLSIIPVMWILASAAMSWTLGLVQGSVLMLALLVYISCSFLRCLKDGKA